MFSSLGEKQSHGAETVQQAPRCLKDKKPKLRGQKTENSRDNNKLHVCLLVHRIALPDYDFIKSNLLSCDKGEAYRISLH